MPPQERLHPVFGRHGLMDDFPVADLRAADHGQVDRLFHLRKGGLHRQCCHLLVGGHRGAGRFEPLRQVLEAERDRPGESVLADGVDGHRGRALAADDNPGRGQTQGEIGLRLADAEPVGVLLSTAPLRVAEVDEVLAVGGQLDHQVGIGVVGVHPRRGVEMIVVQRDHLAVGAGDLDEGVERGVEPAGVHFHGDCLAGAAFHFEDVPIARPIRSAIDDNWKAHLLRFGRLVIGFAVQTLRQRIQCEGDVVGEETSGGGDHVDARLGVLGGRRQGRLFQVPAIDLDLDRFARAAAQGEDAGHERQLADRDPIDKTFAAAVQRFVDCEQIFAVLGDLEVDHRVGVETEIIVIRQFLSAGVAEPQNGLKPAGNAVGYVGDQVARLGGDCQALALGCLKTIPVHLARGNLAVHRARQRDAHFFFFRRPLALGQVFLAEDRQRTGLHRFAGDFGHLTEVEGERIGDAPLGDHPHLAPARFCVGRHGDLGEDQFGLGANGRGAFVFGESHFNPPDQGLLCHLFLGCWGFGLGLRVARLRVFWFRKIRIAVAAHGGIERIEAATCRADDPLDLDGSSIRADGRGKLEKGHLVGHHVVHRRLRFLQFV